MKISNVSEHVRLCSTRLTYVAGLQKRVEDISWIGKCAGREGVLALHAPSVRGSRLAEVGHVDVVATTICSSESERETRRGDCALQSRCRSGRGRRLSAGRIVGPNICDWRMRQSVVEQSDDLVVERNRLWRTLREPAQDIESFRELQRGCCSINVQNV